MPKAKRSAQHEKCIIENVVLPEETSEQEETSSDKEQEDNEVVIQKSQFIQPSTIQIQSMQQMYMPYIEGPKMNWTVNENLYHRILKWEIKCENILDYELPIISQARKCKEVTAWLGDFGID